MSSPSVVQAGEIMLIISLVLIFLVVLSISLHFYLQRQKRRRRKAAPKEKPGKGKDSDAQPELQSKEKKMAELVGTPLCEIGESEPRHEMEDAEVPERHTLTEPEHPNEHPVHIVSPLTPNYDEGRMFGDMTTRASTQPEAGVYAAYLAR